MMPPDSPPAAPSPLTIKLMEVAGNFHVRRTYGGLLPATIWEMTTKEFADALAPVREAMANARQGLDMISVFSAFPTGAVRKQVDAVLLSLSPQPPEAQT